MVGLLGMEATSGSGRSFIAWRCGSIERTHERDPQRACFGTGDAFHGSVGRTRVDVPGACRFCAARGAPGGEA